jgi:signal transduction histidine kinase/DNA-binding response OmpR family regulator/HAMP domain-containing protein
VGSVLRPGRCGAVRAATCAMPGVRLVASRLTRMRRLSIAASVQAALVGLTVVLAIVAGLGVASLYSSRQDYEDRLSDARELQTAAARALAAGVVEEATLRLAPPGLTGRPQRRRAKDGFTDALDAAARLATGDARSAVLLAEAGRTQGELRRAPGSSAAPLAPRNALVRLSARQDDRITDARADARRASRRSFAAIAAGGGLAVVAALALVGLLVGAVRRPLDALVKASRRLAGGEREVRVPEDGPEELQVLARSFNAMAEDVQAAAARVEAERRLLEVTVRSLDDGLVILDADGVVTAANPRAAQLVPELTIGKRTGADGRNLPVPLAAALAGEVTTETGGRTLAVTAAALEHGDGHVLTVRDVSERARLERLKSEFAATASHELRSPLTSIKGFVELLAETDGLTARQRDFVDIVQVSTNRLVELVDDLLDVARVEAGAVEIHRRPTDVAEVVREVAELLGPRVRERSQTLELDVPDDLPHALVDPARLRQVLTNLMTNAHLYTGAGGRLAVTARTVDHTMTLAVADTGRGMSADDAARVFDRFYRAGDDQGGSGTGLGLAIVKSLVDLHGGDVAVDSAIGEGTTFTVRFPRAVETVRRACARDALAGKRVLVVDDEPPIAGLVAERLRELGVRADVVHGGAEALERLRAERYDAVTLDILMPGIGGLEVLRALRADPVLARLPIVVVSVFSGREALSGEWVVGKPIDPEELADTLGAALLAGRVRVLAAGPPALRGRLGTALQDMGIAHDWVTTPEEAAARCAESFYEVAVVDAGLPDAAGTLAVVDLRGRRTTPSVLVAAGEGDAVPALSRDDAQVVALDDVGAVILGLLDPLAARRQPAGKPSTLG